MAISFPPTCFLSSREISPRGFRLKKVREKAKDRRKRYAEDGGRRKRS
jgi:hypothetical protein